MQRFIGLGLAVGLALGAGAASAQTASDHDALALAAIVGGYSPSLSAAQKAVLTDYLASNPHKDAKAAKIVVAAAQVKCLASNVDVTRFECDLTFGKATQTLKGRKAFEIYAALGDAGVQDDGAAGTIYRSVAPLNCTLTPSAIAQEGGGGADCTYKVS
jgi:hypothetical protein